MIDLVYVNNDQFYQAFPDELLIAIFWEETLFKNVVQTKGKAGQSGLGFGQVQEDVLPLINSRMSQSFQKGLILVDEAASVKVACYALETFRRGFQSHSPMSAYKIGYAGATEAAKNQVLDGRTRGAIANDVWQASLDLKQCGWDDTAGVRKALLRARQVSGDFIDAVMAS
jgi:hypothetical protein